MDRQYCNDIILSSFLGFLLAYIIKLIFIDNKQIILINKT
jgi:hypothetical protein